MPGHEQLKPTSQPNRIPRENISVMTGMQHLGTLLGEHFSTKIAGSLRYIDERCFDPKMVYEREYLRDRFIKNDGNLWMAVNTMPEKGTPFDEGNILGYILSSRGHKNGNFIVPNNAGFIDSLAVLPNAQGHGIGRRLRENVFEYWLDLYELDRVHTLARPDNEPMVKLNRDMGLVALKTHKPGLYSDGKPREEYVLTQQAWQAYKRDHPDKQWDLTQGPDTDDPRRSFGVVRRHFDP